MLADERPSLPWRATERELTGSPLRTWASITSRRISRSRGVRPSVWAVDWEFTLRFNAVVEKLDRAPSGRSEGLEGRASRFSHCLPYAANSILSLVTTNSRPLEGFRYSLVGPGRVGSSLAAWMSASGASLVQAVGRPGSDSASRLIEDLGGSAGTLASLARDEVDLLLCTLPDDQLRGIAEDLAGKRVCSIALHTAGSLGASILEPLRPEASVGSFHPLRAFSRALMDPASARGMFFALDGDPKALELGARLAGLWDATAAPIAEKDRDLYHLAARLAAGGVATLLSVAEEMVLRVGLPREVVTGYLSLASGALEEASCSDHPARAITGPLARGETKTVLRQLREVEEKAPELRNLVSAIDLETLRQLELLEGPSEARRRFREVLIKAKKEAR